MIKVVLDTNVLVSGLVFGGGRPSRVLDLARKGHVVSCTSEDILAEFERVLTRKIGYDAAAAGQRAAGGGCPALLRVG